MDTFPAVRPFTALNGIFSNCVSDEKNDQAKKVSEFQVILIPPDKLSFVAGPVPPDVVEPPPAGARDRLAHHHQQEPAAERLHRVDHPQAHHRFVASGSF